VVLIAKLRAKTVAENNSHVPALNVFRADRIANATVSGIMMLQQRGMGNRRVTQLQPLQRDEKTLRENPIRKIANIPQSPGRATSGQRTDSSRICCDRWH